MLQDFVFFLGRFHVLALHLPIGIVIVAVALDWIARRPRYQALSVVAPYLWGGAAISAVVTVALGYMHFAEGAFTGPSASAHRAFGTAVAVATIAIWWLSRYPALYRRLNVVTGIAAVALVAITGHFGGDLTHGSAFLWEYAPQPLRTALGMSERRSIATSVSAADPYVDVVQPLLVRRCGNCHNADKSESGFSVATYESTLKGGESGRVVVPGESGSSELYRRISLPHDDEEFMPAEGKTPLTDAQVEIVRWWIDANAPRAITFAGIPLDPAVEALVAAELGLVAQEPASDTAPPSMVAADPALVQRLLDNGFLVRQVSQGDPKLIVGVYSPGATVNREQVAVLVQAAGEIVELNLQDANLDDEALIEIGKFTELRRLRLSHNRISDRTVYALEGLTKLERLNLYANPGVTDVSVDSFARLQSLRRLDIWQTAMTRSGVDRLRDLRPDLDVQGAADDSVNSNRGSAVR